MRRAGFNKELLAANFGQAREARARGCEWKAGETAWTGYGEDNTYDDAAAAAQGRRSCARPRRAGASALAWDVGCNDGRYARIAAESADLVVALDADHATVDALYRAPARGAARRTSCRWSMSVTDPSPDLGWRGRERASLERRGTPGAALCLAVVHHVCITGNVPVREFLDWLRSLDAALVIEFPDRADPMVQRLLERQARRRQPRLRAGGVRARARGALRRSSAARRCRTTRTLYEARPRA